MADIIYELDKLYEMISDARDQAKKCAVCENQKINLIIDDLNKVRMTIAEIEYDIDNIED